HGVRNVLSFSAPNCAMESCSEEDETRMLDPSDRELFSHLANFNDYAVIFLQSCKNGEGRENYENLANFVMDLTEEQNISVYASESSFGVRDVHVYSYFPFEISIQNQNIHMEAFNRYCYPNTPAMGTAPGDDEIFETVELFRQHNASEDEIRDLFESRFYSVERLQDLDVTYSNGNYCRSSER
ncbi:MAG: hypothetical protein KKH52_02235, partial [Nanoarchaeota archaeon]|nr:hypothetical protein [Nanoarchaeota archaeon]